MIRRLVEVDDQELRPIFSGFIGVGFAGTFYDQTLRFVVPWMTPDRLTTATRNDEADMSMGVGVNRHTESWRVQGFGDRRVRERHLTKRVAAMGDCMRDCMLMCHTKQLYRPQLFFDMGEHPDESRLSECAIDASVS